MSTQDPQPAPKPGHNRPANPQRLKLDGQKLDGAEPTEDGEAPRTDAKRVVRRG